MVFSRFADTLRDLEYKPCLADPDVQYNYVCVYVDDIMHMSTNPQKRFDTLKPQGQMQLQINSRSGNPIIPFRWIFFRDDDGAFARGALTYIKKILSNCIKLFGQPPKEDVEDWLDFV